MNEDCCYIIAVAMKYAVTIFSKCSETTVNGYQALANLCVIVAQRVAPIAAAINGQWHLGVGGWG